MGELKRFFFDTYALYSLIEGRESYEAYKKDIGMITTRLNLMELHYILLLRYSKEIADRYYDRFILFAVDASDEITKRANGFKAANRNKKLSYVDCIGYITSLMFGIKFLTGDKQFKDLENVEFVE